MEVKQFDFPRAEVRKQELAMAKTLIKNLEAKWDPSKYADQYRENLLRIIRAKSKGKTAKLDAGEEARPANGRGLDGTAPPKPRRIEASFANQRERSEPRTSRTRVQRRVKPSLVKRGCLLAVNGGG